MQLVEKSTSIPGQRQPLQSTTISRPWSLAYHECQNRIVGQSLSARCEPKLLPAQLVDAMALVARHEKNQHSYHMSPWKNLGRSTCETHSVTKQVHLPTITTETREPNTLTPKALANTLACDTTYD